MNILITGGLGHIGTYILKNINKIKGIKKIYVIDNLNNQKFNILNFLRNKKIYFRFADLTNHKALRNLPNINTVIHLASITNAEKSFDDPKKIYFNNLGSFTNIVNFCKKNKINLIHISSTSVYGKQNGIVDENCKKLLPQSPYAEIKLKEEKILKKTKKINYITLRFGTICGVSMGMRFHTAVNKFCLNTILKLKIPIWGKVINLHRPYLSLKDAFKAINFIIKKKYYPCEIFNVLSENKTINEILKVIKKNKFNPRIKIVKSKILNQNHYYISNKKFTKNCIKLNGKINTDIEETLKFLKTLSF